VSRPRVGFAGLGAMGSALARRLVGSTDLTVLDLDPLRTRPFAQAGAAVAVGPAELAAAADTIVTCLPTSRDVRELLQSMTVPAGSLIVDCTTGDPAQTRAIAAELAQHGSTLVDAPVSGGPQAADAGTIAILVGADEAAFARAEPILRLISPAVRHVGGIGAGHCVKLLNNALAAGQRMLAFEALALAAAHGVEASAFVDAVNISSGRSYATEITVPRHVLAGRLAQGFSLGLMAKDVGLARSLVPASLDARSLIVQVAERLAIAADELGPATDVNWLIEIFERSLDVTIAVSERGGADDRE
jgi:3-hydroxyisobutyrate dehydrogenase